MAIRQYFNAPGHDDSEATTTNGNKCAQTFTTVAAYSLKTVMLKVYGAFDLTVEIQGVDGVTGFPDGNVLGSKDIAGADMPNTNNAWVKVVFATAIPLSATTEYAIVITPTGGSVKWRIKSAGDYADGTAINDVGAGWVIRAWDLLFECYDDGGISENITTGLQGYWPLNDYRGDTFVEDISGNAKHGTASRNTENLSTAGVLGAAFLFDDTQPDTVNCTDINAVDLSAGQDISVACWLARSAVPAASFPTAVHKYSSADTDGWLINLDKNNHRIMAQVYFANVGFDLSYNVVDATDWHFAVLLVDRDGKAELHVDNGATGAGTHTRDISAKNAVDASTTEPVWIGQNCSLNGNFGDMDGTIDAVGVWDRLLTYGEINYLFNGGSGEELAAPGAGTLQDKSYSVTHVAIANNTVYYQSAADTMSQLTGAAGTLNLNNGLDMFAADGKVFIVNKTIKRVADFRNTKITTDDIAPAGKTAPSRGDTLVDQASGAEMIVDLITATDGAASVYGYRTTVATFTTGETVQVGAGASVQFVLNADETAPPHYYNWITYGNDTANYGELPANATIGAWYFGRAVLSGNQNDPHQWYMSRVLNPWDFNYAASTDDELRAIAGGYEQVGKIPDVVVGVIPYRDDYCVFGSASSCYYMIGNPAGAGEIFELKGTGGLLSKFSHTWDASGNLYLLTAKGILQIPPNFGPPMNLTAESWPEFITDLAYDGTTDRLTMGYDQRRNGLLIANTTMADGSNSCWWYDLNTRGLFPEDYPTTMAIFSQYYSEDLGELMIGGGDGYLRNHDGTVKDDDGTTITSYCSFGPIPLAQSPIGEGSIGPIDVVLGGGGSIYTDEVDSDDADYKVFVADTAAELIEKLKNTSSEVPAFAGTITGPGRRRGSKQTQSARGVYGGVRIGNNTTGENFIFECLNIGAKPKGRSK